MAQAFPIQVSFHRIGQLVEGLLQRGRGAPEEGLLHLGVFQQAVQVKTQHRPSLEAQIARKHALHRSMRRGDAEVNLVPLDFQAAQGLPGWGHGAEAGLGVPHLLRRAKLGDQREQAQTPA